MARRNLYLSPRTETLLEAVTNNSALINELVDSWWTRYVRAGGLLISSGFIMEWDDAIYIAVRPFEPHETINPDLFVSEMLSDEVVDLVPNMIAWTDWVNSIKGNSEYITACVAYGNALRHLKNKEDNDE